MKLHKRDIFTDGCCLRDIAVVAASPNWREHDSMVGPYPTSGTRLPVDVSRSYKNGVPQPQPTNSIIRYFTVKTFQMEPRSSGDQLYMSYDPLTGVRTAAILGLFMVTVMGYILYKSKYNRKRWTSKDRIFIEVYKKKLQERGRHHRGPVPDIRKAVKDLMLRPNFSLVPDLTATWVKCHPAADGTFGTPGVAASDTQTAQSLRTFQEVSVERSSNGRRQSRQDSNGSGCPSNGTVEIQRIPSGTLHVLQAQGAGPPRVELVASQNLNEIKVAGAKRHSIPSILIRDGPLLYDTQSQAVTKFSRIQLDLRNGNSDLRPAT